MASKSGRYLPEILARIGCEVRNLRGGHRGIFDETGARIYTFSSSPSCPHWEENTIKDLEKMGLLARGTWNNIRSKGLK